MNMQQTVIAVQKLQREYEKEHKILDEAHFSATTSNAVKVTLKGDFTLVGVEILDKEVLNPSDPDTLTEIIRLAYNSCKEQIMEKEDELMARFKKKPGGMFF